MLDAALLGVELSSISMDSSVPLHDSAVALHHGKSGRIYLLSTVTIIPASAAAVRAP